mmetsp:Transcript_112842/g.364418  ORF Transcript_112842/g.364418 Transcript_112842/m.364418 type:complete len:160 (+) Transcript_112842:75-554(+)
MAAAQPPNCSCRIGRMFPSARRRMMKKLVKAVPYENSTIPGAWASEVQESHKASCRNSLAQPESQHTLLSTVPSQAPSCSAFEALDAGFLPRLQWPAHHRHPWTSSAPKEMLSSTWTQQTIAVDEGAEPAIEKFDLWTSQEPVNLAWCQNSDSRGTTFV